MAPSAPAPAAPRWRTIRDQLLTELPGYAYGSSFYTIADICSKFDVSIITARRVLDELAAEGLVEKIRKRGTVVRHTPRAASVRLVMASDSPTGYERFSVTVQRQLNGLFQFTQQHRIDFDTLSESHLEMIFARGNQEIGLLLRPQVSNRTVDFVRARKLPYVILDPFDDWIHLPHARADRRQAGYLGARHLIELGHRRIGYVLGPITQRNFRDRLRGYRQALRESGIKFDWRLLQETGGEDAGEDQAAVERLFRLRRPPTAIMTGSDSRALQVLEYCRRCRIRVPQDLSVLAYPGYPESKLSDPPLSIVDGRFEEVSKAAMRLLLGQMYESADPSKQAVTVEPHLVERHTTAPPARKTQ